MDDFPPNFAKLCGELPTPIEIALIAATLNRDGEASQKEAVERAFELWESAHELISEAHQERWWREVHGNIWDNQIKELRQRKAYPLKWPARLSEFLKSVVKGRTLADSKMRFLEFLRRAAGPKLIPLNPKSSLEEVGRQNKLSNPQPTAEEIAKIDRIASARFAQLEKSGLYTDQWVELAFDYGIWWDWKVSKQNAEIAKKKRPTPAAKASKSPSETNAKRPKGRKALQ